jgi:ADP-ribose pyrophosphatase YjhB (NUDIX family)
MSDSQTPLAVESRRGIERELVQLRERYGPVPVVSRTVVVDGETFERGRAAATDGWLGTGEAWVSDADDRVLFVRDAAAPEEWRLPGGARAAEEGVDEAAARAVTEATGVVCALAGVRRAERTRLVLETDPERRFYRLDATVDARYVDGSLALDEGGGVLEARWFDDRPEQVAGSVRPAVDDWFGE